MEITDVGRELMLEGYRSFRAKVHKLVKERLECNPLDLYAFYYKDDAERVKAHCRKMGVDFHGDVNVAEAKARVGLNLIETDIKAMLVQKSKYDGEMKRLGIVLKPEEIRITNGIETCECFMFFADKKPHGPLGHNWFSQNANKILAACDKDNPAYERLEKMASQIKECWVKIAPQEPLPDIKVWRALMNKKVPDVVKDLVSKHSDD